MDTHVFLSDPWIAAVEQIRARHDVGIDDQLAPVRINLVVENVPFAVGTIDAHIDTKMGNFDIGLGHLSDPDALVRLQYGTAKSIIVDGDGQAAMVAFLTRKLRVEGDMSKLLAFQAARPTPSQVAISEEIRSVTIRD